MRGMIGLLLWGVVLGCGSSGSTSSPPQGKADTASPSTDTEKPEDTSTPALETREIPTSGECLTGQVCIDDSDCGAGERCNATLSPPGCHKAYCSGAGQGCDPAHGDALCLPDLFCVETPTAAAPFCADCKPECEGKQCGDDGCGGVCGACEEGLSCTEMSLCDCLPDCDGK